MIVINSILATDNPIIPSTSCLVSDARVCGVVVPTSATFGRPSSFVVDRVVWRMGLRVGERFCSLRDVRSIVPKDDHTPYAYAPIGRHEQRLSRYARLPVESDKDNDKKVLRPSLLPRHPKHARQSQSSVHRTSSGTMKYSSTLVALFAASAVAAPVAKPVSRVPICSSYETLLMVNRRRRRLTAPS
jgi:hypothetical protein